MSVPSIWIHSAEFHKQYSLFTDVAFERLFKALYEIMNSDEDLDDVEVSGVPKLRAHFDARFWNRGQTNVSMYCYSSMSFTIINGLPYIYLHTITEIPAITPTFFVVDVFPPAEYLAGFEYPHLGHDDMNALFL
jgi:hypothetical protein